MAIVWLFAKAWHVRDSQGMLDSLSVTETTRP